MPLDENALLREARYVMADYRTYYNDVRLHLSLHYLCPRNYYRGDPIALLAQCQPDRTGAATGDLLAGSCIR